MIELPHVLRRWRGFVCLAVMFVAKLGLGLTLVEQGTSDYRIIIPEASSPSTRYAAEELQRFIKESTGAELPIYTDAEPASPREILLGNARLAELGIAVDFDALGAEGYLVRTVDERLIIAGSGVRGALYGAYDFLERELGCRWFTPEVSRIPRHELLELAALDRQYLPPLEYREVMLFDCWDADWMARNRLNSTKLLDAAHGGAIKFVPGYYVHTYANFIPAAQYFAEHPEYFAEVDGQRLGEKSQLCGTNEAVAAIIADKVRQLFREHPDCAVISVSQNDANENYCRCVNCAAVDAAAGSHAGQVLTLVNRVAEAVAAEFPDRSIETLAYTWSLDAPQGILPRDNVIVRLTTIKCSFSEPLEQKSHPFARTLKQWSDITGRIWMWDYTTYFSYYPLPWPNYRVLDDNIRFFVRHNVTGVVEQNNWQSTGSAMAPLKGYLLARFLWNPDYDEDTAINEFLDEVYGPAAPFIRQYLDLLSDKVQGESIRMGIYGSRTPDYLTLEILEQADAFWEQASEAVKDDPILHRRVQIARLSLDYAYIEHFRWKPEPMVVYDGAVRRGKLVSIAPEYRARIERFLWYAPLAGITHISEGEPDYQAYAEWLRRLADAPDTSAE